MLNARQFSVGAIFSTFVLIFLPFQPARAYLVPPGEYPIRGTYRGVLPCADCVGVWTELILVDLGTNPFEPGQGSGTFTMTERFTGGVHGGASISTHGKWSTIKPDGFGAGTIELRVESSDPKPLAPRRFYCEHGRSLTLLFDKPNQVVFNRQDTLERVIPPPLPQFVLTEKNSNVPIVARVGDTFQINIPTTLKAHADDAWIMKQPASRSIGTTRSVWADILPDRIITSFLLEAAAPGMARIEYERVKGPPMTVTFLFKITR